MTNHSEITQSDTCDNNVLPVVFFSSYLPYDLKVKYKEGIHYGNHEINAIDKEGVKIAGIEMWVLYKNCKPILKPLSYLTKDENFDLYMDLCEEIGVVRCEHLLLALQDNLKYAFNLQQLNNLEEWLNKNHFDWKYNLIEKGLAISLDDVE